MQNKEKILMMILNKILMNYIINNKLILINCNKYKILNI